MHDQIRRIFILAICSPLLLPSLLSAASAAGCATADCHADLTQLQNQHYPVAEGECAVCHEQVQKRHPAEQGDSFELTHPGADLCYQCHDSMGRKLTVHAPVKSGDCIACHNPHGTESGNALLPVDHDLTPLCSNCHAAEEFSRQVVHGPTASGACSECHNPHEANQPKLLKSSRQQVCARCHQAIATGMAEAPYIHTAVAESDCTACHNPHSAPAAMLLQKDIESLCLDCHGAVGRQAKRAKVKHAALYREEKCSACHATHFSTHEALLNRPEKAVCLGCHGQDDYSKSDPLNNIAKEIEGKKLLHGPLQEGRCSACHSPHGSDHTRLLTGPYPESFYHPFSQGSYDFCLSCHDENLLRFDETSIYTQFRNGKQNLHYLHVSNRYKGRSCRACHEPHAANLDKLMSAEGAEFGDWNIPTRFRKTPTGGSCSPGCHQTYDYDRENPVSYE